MKRIGLSILFSLFCLVSVYSESSIIIKDYDHIQYFNRQKVILIQNKDDMQFTNVQFADSNWTRISVPSKWNEIYKDYKGICWYRIHFKFPNSLPKKAYGISLGEISDKDETYFNGFLIGNHGDFSNPKDHQYDKDRVYQLLFRYILPGRDNVIAIRVTNYFQDERGLINGQYTIGPYEKVIGNYYQKEMFKLVFIIIYLVFAYYFILLFTRRRKSPEYLTFGIFCAALAIYFFLRSQTKYFIIPDFLLLKRIEYIALDLLIPLFTAFILFNFKKKHHWVQYLFYAISTVYLFIFLFTNEPSLWDFLNTHFIQVTWFIGIGTVLVTLIQEFKKSTVAKSMLISLLVLFATMVIDVLYSRNILTFNLLNQFGILSPYGFLFFIVSIGYMLSNYFVRLYKEVEVKTLDLQQTLIERDEAYKKIDSAYIEAINRFSIISEFRDYETGGHIHRVSLYVKLIAEQMNLDSDYVNCVFYASPMHDVGKVGIPDSILYKNGPLDKDEWEIMKKHTTIGGKIFEGAESNVLYYAREIALAHHEKWDGSGYPYGLKGKEIPLSARIMAIADVYDALRNKRPYKKEFTHEQAVEIITKGDNRIKPGDFDPDVFRIFVNSSDTFDLIYRSTKD